MGNPCVLIVDDDTQICDMLEVTFASWGMTPTSITNPLLVTEALKETFYHLILLDVVMPEVSGLDLLADIGELCPDSKVIVITGHGTKESVIQAMRLKAFDYLEKPFAMDLLFRTVKRALDAQKIELERKRELEEIRRSHEDIMAQTAQVRKLNSELIEINRELSILVQNIEKTYKEREEQIFLKIRSLIISIVRKMQQGEHMKKYEPQLAILNSYVEDMISGNPLDQQGTLPLSSSELRIASMIKTGMTTEEIAALLHVTLDTVKTHRRNIRRKLQIIGTKNNLRSYLRSLTWNAADPDSDRHT